MPCEKRKRARLSGNDDERGATATNVLARFSSKPKNKEKDGEGSFRRAGNKAKLLRKHWDISYCRTGKSIIVSETIPVQRADLRHDFVWGHAASTYATRPRMHACHAIKLGVLHARIVQKRKYKRNPRLDCRAFAIIARRSGLGLARREREVREGGTSNGKCSRRRFGERRLIALRVRENEDGGGYNHGCILLPPGFDQRKAFVDGSGAHAIAAGGGGKGVAGSTACKNPPPFRSSSAAAGVETPR